MSLTNKSERRTGLLTVALNQPFTESVTLSHITYSELSLFSHNNSSLIFCARIINNNIIIYVITHYFILFIKTVTKPTLNIHYTWIYHEY